MGQKHTAKVWDVEARAFATDDWVHENERILTHLTQDLSFEVSRKYETLPNKEGLPPAHMMRNLPFGGIQQLDQVCKFYFEMFRDYPKAVSFFKSIKLNLIHHFNTPYSSTFIDYLALGGVHYCAFRRKKAIIYQEILDVRERLLQLGRKAELEEFLPPELVAMILEVPYKP
jgi:hypothetical protein